MIMSVDNPLVSVIIPVYNTGKYLEECMESILSQTYKNIEIVICDDCSTDHSIEIIEKYRNYPRVTILKNEKNLRQAATRNRCIAACTGDYILLQDGGDVSVADRIEKLLKAFDESVDFVGSSCYCFDDSGNIHDKILIKEQYPQKKSLLWGIPHVHASMMIKKKCLDAIGGYRTTKHTTRGEDYDMVMRLYAAGYKGKNISDELYGYRVNGETIARRDFKSRIDECIIRFEGFKSNHILFPLGWLYVFKPIPAYFYQMIKYHNLT